MQTLGPTPPDLPVIPSKRYFTIGEVAALCEIKTHVLRYWEQEFEQISPVKRNKRRYYQRQDIVLLRQIKSLLYEQGYTISGANQWFTSQQGSAENMRYKELLRQTISELGTILDTLKKR